MDAKRLVELRREANLTQEELASRSGLHQTAISQLERDEVASPKVSTMRALAKGLGMTLADIMHELEPEPAEAVGQ